MNSIMTISVIAVFAVIMGTAAMAPAFAAGKAPVDTPAGPPEVVPPEVVPPTPPVDPPEAPPEDVPPETPDRCELLADALDNTRLSETVKNRILAAAGCD